MKLQNYKKLFNAFSKKLKEFDLNSFSENIKNLKIDDLKNINYKRLFYDIRNSQYLKPTVGIFSASLLTIFLLVPAIETINSSLKKAKKYKIESENLASKINQLKNKRLEFEEIKTKMDEINSSFLKNQQIPFIAQLLNETSKKTNVNINGYTLAFNNEGFWRKSSDDEFVYAFNGECTLLNTDDNSLTNNITLYPIPCKDNININWGSLIDNGKKVEVSLISLEGSIINSFKLFIILYLEA